MTTISASHCSMANWCKVISLDYQEYVLWVNDTIKVTKRKRMKRLVLCVLIKPFLGGEDNSSQIKISILDICSQSRPNYSCNINTICIWVKMTNSRYSIEITITMSNTVLKYRARIGNAHGQSLRLASLSGRCREFSADVARLMTFLLLHYVAPLSYYRVLPRRPHTCTLQQAACVRRRRNEIKICKHIHGTFMIPSISPLQCE